MKIDCVLKEFVMQIVRMLNIKRGKTETMSEKKTGFEKCENFSLLAAKGAAQ